MATMNHVSRTPMSYRWSSKWKIVDVKFNDSIIKVCFDEVTSLYSCPLCGRQPCELPEGNMRRIEGQSFFLKLEDLINHLAAHNKISWKSKKAKRVIKEIADEEENEED